MNGINLPDGFGSPHQKWNGFPEDLTTRAARCVCSGQHPM